MLIDAHMHVWRIGRYGQTWPTPDLTAIHTDFLIDDLWAVGGPLGLTGAVVVQSQPSEMDTDWLLETVAADDRILGVVGWVDFEAPDAADRIARVALHSKLKGMRPMLQDLASDWILQPGFAPVWRAMATHDLSLDALVRPRHLPALFAFAERHPDISVVIDHAAKPVMSEDAFADWSADMARLASLPQVHCKLSGLLTELARGQPASAVEPWAGRVFDLFGPDRVMWGSDWPVVNLAGGYADWLAQSHDLCPAEVWFDVFGQTARRFYRLEGAA